jgi:micrococcal nuclease
MGGVLKLKRTSDLPRGPKLSRSLAMAAPALVVAVALLVVVPIVSRVIHAPREDAPVSDSDPYMAAFTSCQTGGGSNCVVDGDTFWFQGEKYRIADIDTPETHPPRCSSEAELGARATDRLRVLLNDGPFQLEAVDRDTDRYGRKLRVVMRNGESLGAALVQEGLAREWTGHRAPWC